MLYFNCLSYEMVQHKLNQELTNIEPSYVAHYKITLKKYIYNPEIKDKRYMEKGFTDKILTAKRSISSSSTSHFVNLGIIIHFFNFAFQRKGI